MRPTHILPALIERFFTERLMRQRHVSPHTIASYRDTFRLLFKFAQVCLRKPPSSLDLCDLDAPLIAAFLEDLETQRSVSVRTRNLRLTAIRPSSASPHSKSLHTPPTYSAYSRYLPSDTISNSFSF